MRTAQDICLLCKNAPAIQKNSHILPRFLKKVILENNPKKHAILYRTDHSMKPVQDIPKEDYILCEQCEKKLGTLETYIARELGKLEKFSLSFNNPTINISGNRYKKLNKVNSGLFALFAYSLAWRMHISKHELYSPFTLSPKLAHKMRQLLNSNLELYERDLKAKQEVLDKLPFPYLFIKPDRIKEATWMIYFNGAPYNSIWFICALSYFIVISDHESAIPKDFLPALNFKIESPKIKILDKNSWQEVINNMINDFKNNVS